MGRLPAIVLSGPPPPPLQNSIYKIPLVKVGKYASSPHPRENTICLRTPPPKSLEKIWIRAC